MMSQGLEKNIQKIISSMQPGKLAYESKDGDIFATIKNQSVTLNDSKGIIFSADAGNSITSLAISSDSNIIASGLSDGSVKLWNIASKKSDIPASMKKIIASKNWFSIMLITMG